MTMSSRIEIIPAVLPKDFFELEEKIGLVKDFVKTVQIDVCDGQFTPQPTWPYRKHDDFFERIIHEEDGLPGWEKLNFEIDLMANKPEEKIEDWVQAGATRIILHAESKGDLADAIEKMSGRVEIGLALNVETPVSVIDQFKDKIQVVQLMGIDSIGFQHQPFDTKVIQKIQEVKAAYPELVVSVDGGVSLETAPQLLEAGAERLVAGSAIFGSDNYIEAIANLKKMSVV